MSRSSLRVSCVMTLGKLRSHLADAWLPLLFLDPLDDGCLRPAHQHSVATHAQAKRLVRDIFPSAFEAAILLVNIGPLLPMRDGEKVPYAGRDGAGKHPRLQ